jgi:3-isopropylmalate dehydrogenase
VRRARVAVIGGDGIGPEVTAEALKVVRATGVEIDTVHYDLGASRYLRTGDVLPDKVLGELRGFDAILLGAVGPPIGSNDIPSGTLERGLLLRLRSEFDLFVNVRPFTAVPGSVAGKADFVFVRENTEGAYVGEGGFLRRGSMDEVATQGSVNTRRGVERCIRYAMDVAMSRPRRRLTMIHKTNVLTYAGELWLRTLAAVASEYPDVTVTYEHADAACIYLVTDAARYDVIVTDNLFGDILTDLAGAVTGGIGFAASANLNPDAETPSLFEPVHGAAHDIAGTGSANPLGAIRSAALMLDYLGAGEASRNVTHAVLEFQGSPGGVSHLSTAEIGDAIAGRVR